MEKYRSFMLGASCNQALQISEAYNTAIGSSSAVYWSADMRDALDAFKVAMGKWHVGVTSEMRTPEQEPSPCVSIFS